MSRNRPASPRPPSPQAVALDPLIINHDDSPKRTRFSLSHDGPYLPPGCV